MGMLVFPTLKGLQIGIKKASNWATIVQTTATLNERRTALASTPVYNFELPYEFLRTRAFQGYELQQLQDFINNVYGSWDSWLYTDPLDSVLVNAPIGIGNGTNKIFQLKRTLPGGTFSEDIWNPNAASISCDVSLGAFTVSNPGGLVTFTTAPPSLSAVHASGSYYYRCRFMSDANEFQQAMVTYWMHQGLQFKGSLQGKI